MHPTKIHNYEVDHGKDTFVPFASLTPQECRAVSERLRRALGVNPVATDLEVLRHIQAKSETLPGVCAESPSFELSKIFGLLNLPESARVFLNWYRLDDIDRFVASDLSKVFGDIWYPAADDIEIFDEHFSFVLSIAHFGSVSVYRIKST